MRYPSITILRASRSTNQPTDYALKKWVRHACPHPMLVTVRLVDQPEGQRLNAQFRGRDYPTNILSFSYETHPKIIGDLVLCSPIIKREACLQHKSLQRHYAHLIVHGMLHLQGYDHLEEAEATKMEKIEITLLRQIHIPNPYEMPHV